jgi:hypothetical protein
MFHILRFTLIKIQLNCVTSCVESPPHKFSSLWPDSLIPKEIVKGTVTIINQ